LTALLAVCVLTTNAHAQKQPQGFAVERLYPAAPGGGWLVMDDLNLQGKLGGALSFSSGYAHNPLRVASADGSQHLSLVEHQAFFAFGAAVTYDRFRVWADFSSPMVVRGNSGTIDDYQFPRAHNPLTQHTCGPQQRVCADLGWNPDTVSDPRFGFDARIYGHPNGRFRLGLSTQILPPMGVRSDYMTDGTFRAMDRVLFAGNIGRFMYAGQLGVHLRLLNDAPAPGSPKGSEMLFGVAVGPRFAVGPKSVVVIGPEIFGETALRSMFASKYTGLEALLTGRYEGTQETGSQVRLKAGIGAGLHPQFGAPEWRAVFAVEMFGRAR
jgi:hypothetical protein